MNRLFLFLCLLLLLLAGIRVAASGPSADSVSIEGRWDLTINVNGKPQPS